MKDIENDPQMKGRDDFENTINRFNNDNSNHGLFVISGPCAVDSSLETRFNNANTKRLQAEAVQLNQESQELGVPIFHRLPIWKPRTSAQTWRGAFHTDPIGALAFLAEMEEGPLPIALEIGSVFHQRFLEFASIAWLGARSIGNTALQDMVIANSEIPMLVKNGLNEDTDEAIILAREIANRRWDVFRSHASVTMMHRGGVSRTPREWEHSLRVADEKLMSFADRFTGSKSTGMVIDLSHGAEFAHRPHDGNIKTREGQLNAAEHIINLLRNKVLPSVVGIMMECSDIELEEHKKTDPNISFKDGVEIIREIGAIQKGRLKITDKDGANV